MNYLMYLSNKIRKANFARQFLFCLMFLCVFGLSAKEYTFDNQVQFNSYASNIKVQTTDSDYTNSAMWSKRHLQQVKNVVSLQLKNPTVQPSASIKVNLSISSKKENGSIENKTVTLEVGTANGNFKDKANYIFAGGHDVVVNVTSVSPSNNQVDLVLENKIIVDRLYKFQYNDVPADLQVCSNGVITSTNEYEICWEKVSWAEEYQLEWTHVNDYEGADLPYNFKTNSTRINTQEPNYRITSLFERGKVLFRVRAITYNDLAKTQILAGKWSHPDKGNSTAGYTDSNIILIGNDKTHTNDNINWQYITNYAENGKKKEVVTYYDGSMRSQQMVTRINSEKHAVVGETVYDHQGRPAIQVLPVPAQDSVLKFHENFNLNTQNDEKVYSRKDFDLNVGDCAIQAQPMSTGSGASMYYSEDNKDKSRFNSYIPDASGFPFSQTEYEPDNTGRIRRQGGVGPEHQLGNALHPTKYYYGKPSQEELNRMFGSEAGYWSHYQKNMVEDANRQLSISYLDMQGNVIATSLAGNPGQGMSALPSNTPENRKSMEINVVDNQPIGLGDSKYVSAYHHLVTNQGDHNFTYKLPGSSFSPSAAAGQANVCLDCIYDITIDIIDECGKRPDIESDNYSTLPIKETIGSLNDICGSPLQSLDFSFTAKGLIVGKYTITRTLSVNKDAYVEKLQSINYGQKTLEEVVRERISEVDFSSCAPLSCQEQCLNSDNYEDCMLECEYPDIYQSIESMMKADFIPGVKDKADEYSYKDPIHEGEKNAGGQYALYTVTEHADGTVTYGADDITSIFHTNNMATIVGQFPNLFVDGNGVSIQPGDIKTFVESFQPEWAEALATAFHPERSCLQKKKDAQSRESLKYDFLMRSTETYEEAYNLGLLDPLGITAGINIANIPVAIPCRPDPFFQGIYGLQFRIHMATYMKNRTITYEDLLFTGSMWEYAVIIGTEMKNDHNLGAYKLSPLSSTDECTRDRVWQAFRALYLAQKAKYEKNSANCTCYYLYAGATQSCSDIGSGTSAYNTKTRRMQELEDYYGSEETTILDKIEQNDISSDDLIELGNKKRDAACKSQAEAQVDNTLKQLSGCVVLINSSNPDLQWNSDLQQYRDLREAFVEITTEACKSGGGVFGASTLPAGVTTASGYNSFSEAMAKILAHNNESEFVLECNPDLISFPKEYGHEYTIFTGGKVIDTCGCNQLIQYNNEYKRLKHIPGVFPPHVTSGKKYFEHETGIAIDNFQAKICLCEKAFGYDKTWSKNANWTPEGKAMLAQSNEYIAAELNCQTCVDCDMLENALNAFNERAYIYKYRHIFGTLFRINIDNAYMRNMRTNFLNNYLGQNKNYEQYDEFISKCTATNNTEVCQGTPEGLQLQSFLNTIIKRWRITDRNCDQSIAFEVHKLLKILDVNFRDENCVCTGYSYEPNRISNNVLNMSVQGQGCNNVSCPTSLSFVDESMGYRFEDIVPFFENIRSAPGSSNGLYAFYIDAHVTYQNRIIKTTMKGYTCFPIEKCYNGSNRDITLCEEPPKETGNDCEEWLVTHAIENAKILYKAYIDSTVTTLSTLYNAKCLMDTEDEVFKMKYTDNEHHFTLYYYDQAGNLIKTIPPAGVQLINDPAMWKKIDAERKDKEKSRTVFTNHRMETRYLYNSLNQLVAQYMPDHEAFDDKFVKQANGLPANMDINSTLFADDNNGILFGVDPADNTKSLIYTTTDGGANWSIQKTSGLKDFNAICKAPGSETLWAVGDGGTISIATNGGQWLTYTMSDIPYNLVGVNLINETQGYVFTSDGRVFTNITNTWVQSANLGMNIEKIYFKDPTNGIVVGTDNGKGVIYKTTDNINWVKQTQIYPTSISDVQMFTSTYGYALGDNGMILETYDGGSTWQLLSFMSTPIQIRKMHFITPNIGIAVSNDNSLFITKNRGVQWTSQNLHNIKDFSVVDGIAYAVTMENKVYKMTSNYSWHKVLTSLLPVKFAAIPGSIATGLFFTDKDTGYSVNLDGKMLKTIDGGKHWNEYTTIGSPNLKILNISEEETYYSKLLKITTQWTTYYKILNTGADNYTYGHSKEYKAVSPIPGSNTDVVVAQGQIYLSNDLNKPMPMTPVPLHNVHTLDNLSIAVGDNGMMLYNNAANNDWKMINTPFRDVLHSVCITPSYTMVGATWGKAYSANNITYSNVQWNSYGFGSYIITDIAYSPVKGVSLLTNANGDIYKKTDNSNSYTPTAVKSGTGKRINDILIYEDESNATAVAVSDGGQIYGSKHITGTSWLSLTDKRGYPLIIDAAQTSNGNIYAITKDETFNSSTNTTTVTVTIAKSTDNGVSWQHKDISNTQLTAIDFYDNSNGVAVGGGKIFRTTTGGDQWNELSQPSVAGKTLNDVYMVSASNFYIVGDNGLITSSITGITVPSGLSANMNTIHFINDKLGFIAGDNGMILKTTDGKKWDIMRTPDGSTNWVAFLYPYDTDKPAGIHGIYNQDDATLYAVGDGGLMLKSIDGGITWDKRESNTGKDLTGLHIKSDNTLVMSGDASAMLRYQDQTDRFSTYFYYDKLGRLIASQNSKQHSMDPPRYSYTQYDERGRVVEVGEVALTDSKELNELLIKIDGFPFPSLTNRYQVTRTIYDKALNNVDNLFTGGKQQNLRNRVASIVYQDVYSMTSGVPNIWDHATHYSYDIHGNVKELIQDNPKLSLLGHQYKKIQYQYDLVSGNVNKVSYQAGKPDQFYHRYEYDDDNRIVKVYTSLDDVYWDNDATYKYYKHGPLARTEIGDQKVQGVDYAYTLQGWIKGVNANSLDQTADMGKDGDAVARDAYGYSLKYYSNDYKQIGSSAKFLDKVTSGSTDLYNGNISNMVTAISGMPVLGKNYQYDELNRLVESKTFEDNGGNTLGSVSKYDTKYTYDANGNILSLNRNGNNPAKLKMDNLTYHYQTDGNGNIRNNRLLHVNDDINLSGNYPDDIDDQGAFELRKTDDHNYQYDKIGNLVADLQEEIKEIVWNVQGKVEKIIRKVGSDKPDLQFRYDALGNRISKTVVYKNIAQDNVKELTTYYVRDAQGNVLAVYEEKKKTTNTNELFLAEQHLYGSSRLGMRQVNKLLATATASTVTPKSYDLAYSDRNLGEKNYELTNHLGNVLAVVSDKKKYENGVYLADVKSATDYYPFGMIMRIPENNIQSDSYRYGFTGHEKEDDITSSTGTIYSTETRLLDTRLGIWRGVDPLFSKYPSESSYCYVGNSLLKFTDPDGREKYSLTGTVGINQGDVTVDVQAGGFSWFPFGGTEMALTLSITYDDESGDITIGLEGSHTDVKEGAFEGVVAYGAGTKETKVGSIGGKVGYNHKEGKFVASGEITPKEETYKTEESGTIGLYTRTERDGEESFSFGLKEVKAGLLILGAKIGLSFDITPSDQKE